MDFLPGQGLQKVLHFACRTRYHTCLFWLCAHPMFQDYLYELVPWQSCSTHCLPYARKRAGFNIELLNYTVHVEFLLQLVP